jgi:hypothetical protein
VVIRLVEEHRRGLTTLLPGSLIEISDAEAMILLQDGIAIPANRDDVARETR